MGVRGGCLFGVHNLPPSPHLKRRLLNLGSTCLLVGWIWSPFLQVGTSWAGAGASYDGCASRAVVGRQGTWVDGRETLG